MYSYLSIRTFYTGYNETPHDFLKEQKMNKTVATAKKFVAKHKVAIAVTITTAVCVTVNQIAMKQHNDFLKEHDLYDTFYDLDEN